MEKLGFNMGDEEKTSQNTIANRAQLFKRRNEFLIHACQCRDLTCSKPLCIEMKQLQRHARDCKMRASGKCSACNFFIRMCASHAQECKEAKCPVPICATLKQKMRQRRQREQDRSYQLAQRRIHKMNQSNPSPPTNEEAPISAPSPATPHVAAVPTPGKMVATGSPNPRTPVNPTTIPASPASLPNPSTPFVPVTPQTPMTKPAESVAPNIVVQPTPAQQFQQSIQDTTQTLINALTSLAPQDKFKAKEYLQKHPDYLPRVINTLKHQQREQEAFQIQQEFMGVPRASIYQNPMPPRPMSRTNMMQGVMPQGGSMMNAMSTMTPAQYGGHPSYHGSMMPSHRMPGQIPMFHSHSTGPMTTGPPQHPHLPPHMMQRPMPGQYQQYNMPGGQPPPQYMRPRQQYQQPTMMSQPIMRQINMGVPQQSMVSQINPQQMRPISMTQYRPPMDPNMGMADPSMVGGAPYQYGANTNNNNNNIHPQLLLGSRTFNSMDPRTSS